VVAILVCHGAKCHSPVASSLTYIATVYQTICFYHSHCTHISSARKQLWNCRKRAEYRINHWDRVSALAPGFWCSSIFMLQFF